ncbi:MAG: hypothetical protein PWQ97_473 [Tepidanaerobacteraceae bacterium]|nr:hypothetical protein [Tepidanaerobacteraceae bacterium]
MGEALRKEVQNISDEDLYASQIAEALRAYLSATGKSQNEVSKAVGISAAALSQFLSGSYLGDKMSLMQKISGFLDLENQRADTIKVPEFVMTSNAKAVITAIEYAHIHNDIALVYGEAGVGKTMAIEYYIKNHTDVIYITANPTISTPKGIVEEILDTLGKHQYGTLRREMNFLVSILKGTGRLIIIDEAQHLNHRALEVLRSIYDQTKIGLVLCGNQEIHDRMYGRGEVAFAQFFSRIGIRRCLQGGVTQEDINLIFHGRLINPECKTYFQHVANLRGGLRYMVKLYMLSTTIAKSRKRALDMDCIREAQKMLMGGDVI